MVYNEITEPIKSEKEKFNGVLKTFHDRLEQIKADPDKMKTAIEEVKTAYGDLLSKIDEGVLLMSQNFDMKSEHNTRSDFEATLLNFLSMIKSYYTNFGDVIKELGYAQGLGISKFTYRNIQKYFNTYSSNAVMQGTKVDFESLAIDLTGYDEKFEDSKKEKRKQNWSQIEKERPLCNEENGLLLPERSVQQLLSLSFFSKSHHIVANSQSF